jgi:hypothetical protein
MADGGWQMADGRWLVDEGFHCAGWSHSSAAGTAYPWDCFPCEVDHFFHVPKEVDKLSRLLVERKG